jgi:hypothetical protein
MSKPGSQFVYFGRPDANCFASVCAVVISKSITNVY